MRSLFLLENECRGGRGRGGGGGEVGRLFVCFFLVCVNFFAAAVFFASCLAFGSTRGIHVSF